LQLLNHLKLQAAEVLWGLPRSSGDDSNWRECEERLITDGCFALEGFIEANVIDRIATAANAAYVAHKEHVAHESNRTDERIYGVERLDDAFVLAEEMRAIDELSSRFYKTAPIKWFQVLGRITFAANNLGSGSGWHRDSPFSHQFKAILYLSDVGPDNGPFQYIKGSHRKEPLVAAARSLGLSYQTYRFPTEQIERLERENVMPSPTTFTGRRGTLLLADTRGLHRGQPLRAGARLALTRYYFPRRIPDGFSKNFPLTR
jgi:hypothetical protein